MKKVDVIIVGAGISGLAAAYEAKKAGLSFVVLEAKDRVGGRIHSHTFSNSLVVELGAEWIGKTHSHLLKVCRELGITLEPHTYLEPRFIYKNGKEDTQFGELLYCFEQIVRKMKYSNISPKETWYEHLRKSFSEEEMRKLSIVYSADFAEHLRYVSAQNSYTDLSSGGENDHMDYHTVGGNSKIIHTLAKQIGSKNILCNSEVVSITDDANGVYLITKTGEEYQADSLLMTSGMQAFAQIKLHSSYKVHKEIARKLKYGDITKYFVVFESPLPLSMQNFSMFSDGDLQYIYVATQGQSKDRFALCIYSVGSRAKRISRMSKEKIWSLLKKVLPKDVFDIKNMTPTEVYSKNWGTDTHTKGAFAVFQPTERDTVLHTFGSPIGNIYFAGEHMAHMFGYMNGAVQSGQDSMKVIINKKKG
jgi:monoamine oxidase